MVTTANDGFMKLWDVSKVCQGIPHVLQTVSFRRKDFSAGWLLCHTWIALILAGL